MAQIDQREKLDELNFALELHRACSELILRFMKDNVHANVVARQLVDEANTLSEKIFDEDNSHGLTVNCVLERLKQLKGL